MCFVISLFQTFMKQVKEVETDVARLHEGQLSVVFKWWCKTWSCKCVGGDDSAADLKRFLTVRHERLLISLSLPRHTEWHQGPRCDKAGVVSNNSVHTGVSAWGNRRGRVFITGREVGERRGTQWPPWNQHHGESPHETLCVVLPMSTTSIYIPSPIKTPLFLQDGVSKTLLGLKAIHCCVGSAFRVSLVGEKNGLMEKKPVIQYVLKWTDKSIVQMFSPVLQSQIKYFPHVLQLSLRPPFLLSNTTYTDEKECIHVYHHK